MTWVQADLANKAGLSVASIKGWEPKNLVVIDSASVQGLASAFDREPAEFLLMISPDRISGTKSASRKAAKRQSK